MHDCLSHSMWHECANHGSFPFDCPSVISVWQRWFRFCYYKFQNSFVPINLLSPSDHHISNQLLCTSFFSAIRACWKLTTIFKLIHSSVWVEPNLWGKKYYETWMTRSFIKVIQNCCFKVSFHQVHILFIYLLSCASLFFSVFGKQLFEINEPLSFWMAQMRKLQMKCDTNVWLC